MMFSDTKLYWCFPDKIFLEKSKKPYLNKKVSMKMQCAWKEILEGYGPKSSQTLYLERFRSLLALQSGTCHETIIQIMPVKISETGQAKTFFRYSAVNRWTAVARPASPEKKNDFICLATLPKTKAIDAIGKRIR